MAKQIPPKKGGKKEKFWEKVSSTSNPKKGGISNKKWEKKRKEENKDAPTLSTSKRTFSPKDKPKRKPPVYDANKLKTYAKKKGVEIPRDSEEIRLNRFISNSGICSRREADQLIQEGKVTVNGKVVKELGTKITRKDVVKYNGKKLQGEQFVYVLLNKPKGFITTTKDPEGRKTVMDLVKNACEERIYPVGRLDRETVGLLLFTNDGELAKRLTHPANNIRKVYRIELDKVLADEHFKAIGEGIELEDGFIKPVEFAMNNIDKTVAGLEIHSGRNRIVRRIFEHFGYKVNKLDRTSIAGLTKKDLPRGHWRYLTQDEVIRLKFLGHNNKTEEEK